MKLSKLYEMESILFMLIASAVVISVFLLSLSLDEIPKQEDCIEAAKVDYGMKNPKCDTNEWSLVQSSDCACKDRICKQKSCTKPLVPKYFDLKDQ